MTLNELTSHYIALSNKADNYWVTFIVITGAILAVNLPEKPPTSYFVATGLVLIYAAFVIITSWALNRTYETLNIFAKEIESRKDIEDAFNTESMKIKYKHLPQALTGITSKFIPWLFLAIVVTITIVKVVK